MKKFCLLLAIIVFVVSFAACGTASATSSSQAVHVDGTLEELMEKVYEGIAEDEMPAVANTELTADNSVYYTGVESSNYEEGLASEAMISAIAEWNVKIVERTRLYLPGFFSYNPPEVYFCADTPHPKSSSRA